MYCPQGAILRQKSLKKDGRIRYCNKLACKKYSHKCTKAAFKEADFNKDTLVMKAQNYKVDSSNHQEDQEPPKTKMKREVKEHKIVTYKLYLDKKKMAQRMCLSEHPFGTMKRTLGAYYFLLKTKVKVEAEMPSSAYPIICVEPSLCLAFHNCSQRWHKGKKEVPTT